MKIKELIAQLEKHPNQDAQVLVKTNFINSDEEVYDIPSQLNVLDLDAPYQDFLDIVILPDLNKSNFDIEDNIRSFLSKDDYGYDKLSIEIDPNFGIFLYGIMRGQKRELQREIEFDKEKLKIMDLDQRVQEIALRLARII